MPYKFFFQPKYQKILFRIGGSSNRSSLSATVENGRSSDHHSMTRANRELQVAELQPQLSVIQEDRVGDQGENSSGTTSKDDRKKKKKKQAKHKGKEHKGSGKNPTTSLDATQVPEFDSDEEQPAETASVPLNRPTVAIECSDALSPSTSNAVAETSGAQVLLGPATMKDGRGLLNTDSFMKGCLSLNPSSSDLASGEATRISVLRQSASRRSSRTDLTQCGGGDGHRRTTSVISAANSFGSGLDDDDLIDPQRDVGIAVSISSGFFTWHPQSTEPLISDVNFTADAGGLLFQLHHSDLFTCPVSNY
jgi:hypothetical protein